MGVGFRASQGVLRQNSRDHSELMANHVLLDARHKRRNGRVDFQIDMCLRIVASARRKRVATVIGFMSSISAISVLRLPS